MTFLETLAAKFDEKNIRATYKKIKTEKVEQERLYVELNKQFNIYFIEFEKKPFLKVYIARPKGFDYVGIKQSDEETLRCKKAKLQIITFINNSQIEIANLEKYDKAENVLLSPKSNKVQIEIKI